MDGIVNSGVAGFGGRGEALKAEGRGQRAEGRGQKAKEKEKETREKGGKVGIRPTASAFTSPSALCLLPSAFIPPSALCLLPSAFIPPSALCLLPSAFIPPSASCLLPSLLLPSTLCLPLPIPSPLNIQQLCQSWGMAIQVSEATLLWHFKGRALGSG